MSWVEEVGWEEVGSGCELGEEVGSGCELG